PGSPAPWKPHCQGRLSSRAQGFQLLQPQDAVSVPVGETLTLTCSVSLDVPVGPVKWFKDSGPGRQLVYEEKGSFPRLNRTEPESTTDFTIRIRDIQDADAGVYRCVKFKRGTGPDEEIRSGAGTNPSVPYACLQNLLQMTLLEGENILFTPGSASLLKTEHMGSS
uniref:Ig-like domain-containing protein n=1 Tax=Pelusios castaneus TaxID=367368 RepID=A0A8C8R6U3_9SAUR